MVLNPDPYKMKTDLKLWLMFIVWNFWAAFQFISLWKDCEDIVIRHELEKCHNQLFKVRQYSVSCTVLIYFLLWCWLSDYRSGSRSGSGSYCTDFSGGQQEAKKKPKRKLLFQIFWPFLFFVFSSVFNDDKLYKNHISV